VTKVRFVTLGWLDDVTRQGCVNSNPAWNLWHSRANLLLL